MNKKPYNEIEAQIKAAASQWEPDWDEHAWKQMEAMLNEDDEHKKPVAWWRFILPVFIVGGLITFFIVNSSNQNKKTAQTITTNAGQASKEKQNINTSDSDKQPTQALVTESAPKTSAITTNNSSLTQQHNPSKIFPSTKNKNRNQYSSAAYPLAEPINNANQQSFTDKSKTQASIVSPTATADLFPEQAPAIEDSSIALKLTQEQPLKSDLNAVQKLADSIQQNSTHKPIDTVQQQMKRQMPPTSSRLAKTKSNQNEKGFTLTLHAGVESNGTQFPGTNKLAPRAGLMAGYFLNSRWSINAGFFASNKKYIAGPNDYKAKPGSYWSTVQITKIDANCRVFEIPLAVQYHFAASSKHKSYAGLGLSSFIMDKEDYNYDYIRYNNPYHASAQYKGNKHWFSVLRLYGGLQKNIAPNILLTVQPGLAIPLAGVGEGQIKLYASELLLGIQYRLGKKH